SNAVVSSLFDRISTCRIARPLLDARSGTQYFIVTSVIAQILEKWEVFYIIFLLVKAVIVL
ncbi:MAG: hypothetical protein ACLTJH_08505, partial [Lachnospiraceae bacterium]